ncbi:Calx-beta domain-containing protein [Flavobacterium sp.]|uniref:Ig-like domain-containing protein n=1 Tax=Flavobacterium sp. TaxID=239 RepID=UPI002B4B41B7|nr:T9SS type A sorting domain-containing protein [Flavobacterium sp.]HLP63848.1 T9SS type A sorting domain-containing protein [Flavobacterium sp.]
MKKMTQKLMFLFLLFAVGLGYSQKVAVIGINHTGTDGFSFVATQDLAAGEVIYFTENEYNDASNTFIDTSEAVVQFTALSTILKGNVVFVNELATANTFSVTCTGGGSCGTAVLSGAGPFALGTGGESLYAYTDSDSNPLNGITTIYSVLFTGYFEGANVITGGDIVASQNPVFDFPNAIVIDGFPSSPAPDRTEFIPTAPARTNVSKVVLENPSNYVHAQTSSALSTIFFTNLNLVAADPVVSVTASPLTVNENSGTGMVYTFSLSATATSNLTINFSVGGSATFGSDYSQSGAASFNASAGSVTILNGSSTATITLTPVGDSVLEANESILLTLTGGSGYVAGSPGSATTTINNDDTLAITPIVAVTGVNHSTTADGFSFVALQDIAAGTVVYFTENPFTNSTLTFSGTEAVMQWTAPAGGLARGQVVVATETGANTFTTTCSSGGCGSVSVVSGTFTLATAGEEFYAYLDSDSNPSNGVTSVQAVLFTGTSVVSGGVIPSAQDPALVYPGAVVVDGFPATAPLRTEYNPALRGTTVDRANFQNPANWINGGSNITLSTVPFANIIISTGVANPFASVTVAPSSVAENSGTAMVYTFALSSVAASNITVNFNVGGTATFTTDYTASGASSFTASAGSVVIPTGSSSATVSVTPVGDLGLEVQESIVLTITGGTGYDGGSPNAATGFINNDDTTDSDPLVALVGMSHVDPDGFSFVAAQDIPANTVVYFTDNSFNNSTLLFGSGEGVIRWTSPGTAITKGNVVVVTETAPDTFSVTCSNGTCGSVTLISGNLAIATTGETLYAYEDNDTNPSNGVTDIYAVLFTGTPSVSGGNLPSIEDPSNIFLKALVVDGFPATAPARTEYDPTKRAVAVSAANFEDVSNWIHAQSPPALSTVPFANLNIVDNVPPTAVCQNISVTPNVGTGSVTITASQVDNGSSDNAGAVTLSVSPDTFTCANVGTPVTVTLTVTDTSGNTATCTSTVTVLPNVTSTFSQVAPICSGDSFTLPTTSNNGFTGTWSPAINNTATTEYTFTPDAGQCGGPTTMTVVVNPGNVTTTTISACDSYTWSVNGTTYTESGTYTVVSGCDSQVLELTINATPVVDIAQPAVACEGDTVTLTATVSGTNVTNGFSGAYDVANWTFTNSNANGSVDTSGAPGSIVLTSGDNGSNTNGNTDYSITIPSSATISFNWNYNTGDGAQFDIPRVVVNGTPTNMNGYDTSGGLSQSGSMTLTVNAGDTFSFNMFTTDNVFGAGTVAISNLAITTIPNLLWTAADGGTIVGATNGLTVNVTTSGTYTLTATNGTCVGTDSVSVVFNPLVTPTFDSVAPICSGDVLSSLPTTSLNGITGAWSPALNNTITTTYTFIPDAGQCANTTTLTITVNSTPPPVSADLTVTFTGQCGFLSGTYVYEGLLNGKASFHLSTDTTLRLSYDTTKWVLWCCGDIASTGFENTNVPAGLYPPLTGWVPTQCLDGTMDISNNSSFELCDGATIADLGVTGTSLQWYDAETNGNSLPTSTVLVTGAYYVSQTLNGCESPRGQVNVVINPNVLPTFDAVAPICTGGALSALPTTSLNGITGTWSPALDNTATTTYLFTPDSGQCALSAELTIVVNSTPAPTGSSAQTLSVGSTLANVAVTGTNIQWYDAASNGNLLPSSTVLVNGTTYYATQTLNGCESPTLAVTVTVGTGVTNVIATQCGSTLADYNSVIYANLVPGAQAYRFRVTDLETNQVIIKDYALRNLYLRSLSFYRYDQAYSIEVAVRRNNIWEPYGAACVVSTPVALTQLRAAQCGSTLLTSSDLVYADYVYATTSYRFRVTNTLTNSVQIIDRPIRSFAFSLVTDYSIGTVYNVDVAVMNTDGTYLPFGPVCSVTTPGSPLKELTTKSVVEVFEVVGTPNPFSENFKLNVTSSSVEPISVSVYDMLGKLIETKEVSTNDIENFEAGVNYPNGVYNIIVTQGDNAKSVRMIKR